MSKRVQPSLLVALDAVSALALLALATGFVALWRFTRDAGHAILAVAFATLGAGVASVSASEFELPSGSPWVDGLRMVCHTAAPLMMVSVYRGVRRDAAPRAWVRVLAAFAVAAAATLVVWLLPPEGSFAIGTERNALVVTHGIQFTLYLTLVVLAGRRFVERPSTRRALVPLAFMAYAFSKYTWVLIDLDGHQGLVPLIYFWRFLMIGLVATAFFGPLLRARRDRGPA